MPTDTHSKTRPPETVAAEEEEAAAVAAAKSHPSSSKIPTGAEDEEETGKLDAPAARVATWKMENGAGVACFLSVPGFDIPTTPTRFLRRERE